MSIGATSGTNPLDPTATAAPATVTATATLATPSFSANATLREIAAGHGSIGRGSRGEAAKVVQQALIDLGHLARSPGADGIFGNMSVAAVQAFQRSVGLRADGVVGPKTLAALDKKLAERAGGGTTNPPVVTPPVVTPPRPTAPKVVEGTSAYSLDDDTLIMTSEGTFESSLKRDIYTAGYLPRTEGPLNHALGSKPPASSVLSAEDKKLNSEKSPVQRFDEAMKRSTGTAGKLNEKYAVDGKQPEAKDWWGYCDRWCYNALDPEIATRVNKPILYNGVYFSTAELRGLATYLGRADEGRSLFDTSVSALDLQKAVTMFVKENGPGFIADVWNDKAKGENQVWNQPFDGVKQNVKELKGADLEKVLKEQFNLTGPAAAGKRIFYVETKGVYGVEAGEEHEGAATHAEKNWKTWVVTNPDGTAVDGKYAPGSDDALEYIWRPDRTGNFNPEAKFFRDLLKGGVPAEKVSAFESALAALPAGPLDAAKKADLKSRFAGVAAAYTPAALTAKLAPYGLTAVDLK